MAFEKQAMIDVPKNASGLRSRSVSENFIPIC
jgi:hypothetical protein